MPTVEYVEIKHLTLIKDNPRTISKHQFEKLCKSLEEDPTYFDSRPCLINRDDEENLIVYSGNQRVKAAKKIGWKKVPCMIEKCLSDELMKQRIIKDNKTYGKFDYDVLGNLWDIEILLECGFEDSDLTDFETSEAKEIKKKEEKQKDQKLKMCPECGHEF